MKSKLLASSVLFAVIAIGIPGATHAQVLNNEPSRAVKLSSTRYTTGFHAVRSDADSAVIEAMNTADRRSHRAARGMSTSSKVLVGVAVAAGVIAVVALIASRDKIKTF